jgi:hypothetical protein
VQWHAIASSVAVTRDQQSLVSEADEEHAPIEVDYQLKRHVAVAVNEALRCDAPRLRFPEGEDADCYQLRRRRERPVNVAPVHGRLAPLQVAIARITYDMSALHSELQPQDQLQQRRVVPRRCDSVHHGARNLNVAWARSNMLLSSMCCAVLVLLRVLLGILQ